MIIAFPILLGSGFLDVMKQDFAKMIQENPNCLRILEIRRASMPYLTLRLLIFLDNLRNQQLPNHPTILCTNAVEYSIRPMNPNTIEGGPLVEYHEEHELLNKTGLQMIPEADGEIFVSG